MSNATQSLAGTRITSLLDAMPVKIDYGTLDAMSGSVALTTVELVHGDIVTIM